MQQTAYPPPRVKGAPVLHEDLLSRSSQPRTTGAFSLVELLVALVVLAVLVTLALPLLSHFMARRNALACLSNARSAALMLTHYTQDHDDSYPFAGYAPRSVAFDDRWEFTIGGEHGLRAGRWSLLFPDEWSGTAWPPSLQCPKQPAFDPALFEGFEFTDGSYPLPLMSMSSAMWLAPEALSDAATTDGLAKVARSDAGRVRPARVSDVVFPAAKCLVFEYVAFCPSDPGAREWIESLGQTPFFQSSIILCDGSGARRRRVDGLRAAFGWPFDHTLHGVRGRDIP